MRPGAGSFKHSTNDASIYWHPAVSGGHANTVGGLIRGKWAGVQWENGVLGYPTTREIRVTGGAYNDFKGGSIYWSPSTGAQITWGEIRTRWRSAGAERTLGFPKAGEQSLTRYGGKFQTFERASVYWSPLSGAHVVGGAIGTIWGQANWENGNYGYPTTEEFDIPGGKRQIFQGGPIDWYADGRAVGEIQMSTFRWQDYIPDEWLMAPCDIAKRAAILGTIGVLGELALLESYKGDGRSYDPEGSHRIRIDVNVAVDQSRQGAKAVKMIPHIGETTQKWTVFPVGPNQTFTRTADANGISMTPVSKASGDYPDVVRFKINSLSHPTFLRLSWCG
ncbi:MAG: LGFP repeat-containing protein [Mycobacteriaceae bacterium]